VSMDIEIDELGTVVAGHCSGPMFAVPGGGPSLDLLHSVAEAGMDVVLAHSEMSAAVMAATVGRLTGRPGVVTTIRGPGVAGLASGLAFASLEGDPVVSLSELLTDTGGTVHKWMDHPGLLAASVKQYGSCSIGRDVERAASLALAPRRGPVALGLSEVHFEPFRPSFRAADARSPAPVASDAVTRLRSALAGASCPVLVVGSGARHHDLGAWLAGLACPVGTTAAAKGIIPETSPNSAGVMTGAGGVAAPEGVLLSRADLLVRIGVHPHELLGPLLPASGPTIDLDPQALSLEVRASIGALLDRVDADFAALAANARGLRARLIEQEDFLPAAALATVASRVRGTPRLVTDTGDFCTVAEHVWSAADESGFLGAGSSRFMGTGIAMALACGLVDPGRPTVLAVGDGGIGPAFGELTLAVERRLPLLVLHLSDGGFASIRGRARTRGLSGRFTELPDRSWWRAAEGLGIPSATLGGTSTAEDLAAVLEAWDPARGPSFVSVRFEMEAYQRMTEGLR
jgi:acetolactate synthase-1/2/3 large subunit